MEGWIQPEGLVFATCGVGAVAIVQTSIYEGLNHISRGQGGKQGRFPSMHMLNIESVGCGD